MGYLDSAGLSHFWGKVQAALAGKQNAITAGDGLSKEGDTLSVTTPVRGIVTQAEFEALPEAQKSKGLYLIEDGASGGTPANIYDAQERVVGTWFGKPLYRKCYEGNMTLTTENSATILDPAFSDKSIAAAYGQVITAASYQYAVPYSQNLNNQIITISVYKDPTGNLKLIHHFTGTLSAIFQIVAEYTKNTDQEATSQ